MGEQADRKGGRMRWTLAILWTMVFLYFLIAFSPTDSSLTSLVNSWSRRLGLPSGTFFKAGHVFGYVLWIYLWCGVLCGGYRTPLPKCGWVWIPLGIVLLAAVPEGLQRFNPDRHPAWMDVGLNVMGSLTGLGIRQLLVRREPTPAA